VKRKYILVLILTFVFLLIGMGLWNIRPKEKPLVNDKRISVVTSIYPLFFFAGEVGKDKIRLTNLTPAGVEPHDYEPTAKDMIEVHKAILLILNGGNFETWGERVKGELNAVAVVEAGRGLFTSNDSHIWLSPKLAKEEVKTILTALSQTDPGNKNFYEENAKILISRLDKLTADYKTGLSDCKKREIITSHAAFGYLTQEFGLTQIPVSGLSPDEEPSTKRLTEISKIAKDTGIKYIFFEKLVSARLAETIADEVGAKTMVLDPIEGISDNDLSQGKNYISIMEDNLTNLRIALECR
jgi:zinc transport system substrate-binding protein